MLAIDCPLYFSPTIANSLYVLRPPVTVLRMFGKSSPIARGDVVLVQPSRSREGTLDVKVIRRRDIFSRNRKREWPPGGPHAIVAYRVIRVIERRSSLWSIRLKNFGPDGAAN